MPIPNMSIPTSVLAQTPAQSPPPGVTPNFVDPPTEAPIYLGVASTLQVLLLLFACTRVRAKLHGSKGLMADDCAPCHGYLWLLNADCTRFVSYWSGTPTETSLRALSAHYEPVSYHLCVHRVRLQ